MVEFGRQLLKINTANSTPSRYVERYRATDLRYPRISVGLIWVGWSVVGLLEWKATLMDENEDGDKA